MPDLKDFTVPGAGDPTGTVLVLHGGRPHGDRPVDWRSASWQRANALAGALAPGLASRGFATRLLRFSVAGWNGPLDPAPLADADWALEQCTGPVVLLGHSMGARTAARVADHPDVLGLVALAPWFPEGEPVDALRDRRLVALHGSRDRITSARATRDFCRRAEPLARSVEFIDMGLAGHYLLSHVRLWHRRTLAAVASMR